jgi:hypothetical protein
MIAKEQHNFVAAGSWYIQSIGICIRYQDQYHLQIAIGNFMRCYQAASPEEQAKTKALWEQADLGPFPADEDKQEEHK